MARQDDSALTIGNSTVSTKKDVYRYMSLYVCPLQHSSKLFLPGIAYFQEHLEHLRYVLARLQGCVKQVYDSKPDTAKTDRIRNYLNEVRQFLGLAS